METKEKKIICKVCNLRRGMIKLKANKNLLFCLNFFLHKIMWSNNGTCKNLHKSRLEAIKLLSDVRMKYDKKCTHFYVHLSHCCTFLSTKSFSSVTCSPHKPINSLLLTIFVIKTVVGA